MNGHESRLFQGIALAAGVCMVALPIALADITATGTAEMTNIHNALADSNAGSIDWFYNDGSGNPAWQAEAWVHAADSFGGADADYNTTPDGFGMVSAFASTALGWGSADVDLFAEGLHTEMVISTPVNEWANVAPQASMYNYFTIIPAGDGFAPIEMTFSFDYMIHLTGESEPGGGYAADAGLGMTLQILDGNGDWQPVPGGNLFHSEYISGADGDTDDLLAAGSLDTTLELEPDQLYSIGYRVYENVPQPGTLALVLAGGLLAAHRRRI